MSIKGVADVAGVTTRAVRHYHATGLLVEPPRDSSGYRSYGASELIALVRISRLRSLGMPLAQIKEHLSTGATSDSSLTDALDALAGELEREIAELSALRQRLRGLAESEMFEQPSEALTHVLQERGLLGPSEHLRSGEEFTAVLLDALHPEGLAGLLTQARDLLDDPSTVTRLRARLAGLTKRTSQAELDQLVDDVVRVLPQGRGSSVVDVGLLDTLISERLSPVQRRFMHSLRARVQAQPNG